MFRGVEVVGVVGVVDGKEPVILDKGVAFHAPPPLGPPFEPPRIICILRYMQAQKIWCNGQREV